MLVVAEYVRWALIVLGLVYLVTESAIFAPVRVPFARRHVLAETLIYCPSCTGFWVGLCVALWSWPAFHGALSVVESGIAAMALGALWSVWRGGNPIHSIEMTSDHSQTS